MDLSVVVRVLCFRVHVFSIYEDDMSIINHELFVIYFYHAKKARTFHEHFTNGSFFGTPLDSSMRLGSKCPVQIKNHPEPLLLNFFFF